MQTTNDTLRILKDAKSKAINLATQAKTAGNLNEKIRWEKRRIYIEKQIHKFEGVLNKTMVPKRVFISYSKMTGQQYFNLIKALLNEKGFDVIDGFRKRGQKNESNVLKRVRQRISSSSIYLGILTADIKIIDSKSKKTKYSPSVWTMEEKGMAIGLEKSFVLAVHKNIHEDFWAKTAGNKEHIIFNSKNDFMSLKAFDVVEEIIDRYEEVALRFIHDTEI